MIEVAASANLPIRAVYTFPFGFRLEKCFGQEQHSTCHEKTRQHQSHVDHPSNLPAHLTRVVLFRAKGQSPTLAASAFRRKSIMDPISKLAVKGSLPKRLVDFFARYPPRLYGTYFTNETLSTTRTSKNTARERAKLLEQSAKAAEVKTSPVASLAAVTEVPSTSETSSLPSIQQDSLSESATLDYSPLLDPETSAPLFEAEDKPPNPFLPYRNPATGRWRGAPISLRRQADLFKLARFYGVEPLLPASRKSTQFKEQRLLDRAAGITGEGIKVRGMKGTGEGDKVKGHIWERQMGGMLEKRIAAMEKMPELIREWRMRGNGRKWKKYPSSKGL